MALLHSLALANAPNKLVFAALVGRIGGSVPLGTFVRVGAIVTVPLLLASLVALWLVT